MESRAVFGALPTRRRKTTFRGMKATCAGALLGAMLMGAAVAPIAGFAADAVSQASVKNSYVGTWKVTDSKGRVFFIEVKESGEASSRWEDPNEARRGRTGTWEAGADKVVIVWDNGWRDVIGPAQDGAGFVKRAFAPKLKIEGKPTNEAAAEKVN